VGDVKVVDRSGGVLNRGDPKGSGAYPPDGDPHGVDDDQYPWLICGWGVPLGWPRYDCGGGHQKPGFEGSQNPAGDGGGHVGGAPAAEDPPTASRVSGWEACNTKKQACNKN
jgi:hypothetical protein